MLWCSRLGWYSSAVTVVVGYVSDIYDISCVYDSQVRLRMFVSATYSLKTPMTGTSLTKRLHSSIKTRNSSSGQLCSIVLFSNSP